MCERLAHGGLIRRHRARSDRRAVLVPVAGARQTFYRGPFVTSASGWPRKAVGWLRAGRGGLFLLALLVGTGSCLGRWRSGT
jgi:hypothetical protein